MNDYIRVFRAFTDESRIRVLEILRSGEHCACVLLEDLQISQPTLSHHMKILCDSGIVKSRKVGKWNYYSINAEGCTYASKLLNDVKDKNIDKILAVSGAFHHVLRPVRKLLGLYVPAEKKKECYCCCTQDR